MGSEGAPYALVVEDDVPIRIAALDIIEDAGFEGLGASTADEALPLLQLHEGEIALLFTDVEMPGSMDGMKLARHVAARWPDIGILVASGRVTPSDGDLPTGAIFLGKPFSADVVHDRIVELLPDGKKPEPLRRREAKK